MSLNSVSVDDTLIAHPGSPQERHYQLLDVLGEGGTGVTYRAQAQGIAQPVAIKMLTFSGQKNWDGIERFEREAKVLAKLQHPGIPRYLDYFYVDTDSDRTFCIVQQLAEGQTLAQRVEQGKRFSEKEVKHIAAQLLNILIYLHQQTPPVIHRDLKPHNVLIDANRKLYLVDFGAVQNAYYDTFMQGGTMVGTYGYMAPEQFRGQAMPGTDLYGLGAMLLFLLTHRSPSDFPVEDLTLKVREHLKLSDDFGRWLEKLLEPDVEDRFATAEAALAALQQGMPRPLVQGMKKTDAIFVGAVTLVALITINHFKFPILNQMGFTPREMFEQGINKGDVEVVKKYLDKGISPNSKAYYGSTLLHWAVSNNRPQVVDLLIERGAKLDQVYKPDGRTVLHVGAQHDQAEVAAVLLQRGAQVNRRDYDGNTPLHKALLKDDVSLYFGMATTSRRPSEEMIELLVAAGADLDAINDQGETPRTLVTQKGLDHLLPPQTSTVSRKP